MVADLLAHGWDIAAPLGLPLEPDAQTLAVAEAAVRPGVRRQPGFMGEEVAVPQGATAFMRYLGFLDREAAR